MDVPAVPLTNPTARPWKSWRGVEVLKTIGNPGKPVVEASQVSKCRMPGFLED